MTQLTCTCFFQEHRQVHIEYKVEVDQVLSPEELKQSDLTPLNLPSTDPQTKGYTMKYNTIQHNIMIVYLYKTVMPHNGMI